MPNFDNLPIENFQGEVDELETLQAMVDKMDVLTNENFNANLIIERGGVKVVSQRLINFASSIAREESFPVVIAETDLADGVCDSKQSTMPTRCKANENE